MSQFWHLGLVLILSQKTGIFLLIYPTHFPDFMELKPGPKLLNAKPETHFPLYKHEIQLYKNSNISVCVKRDILVQNMFVKIQTFQLPVRL